MIIYRYLSLIAALSGIYFLINASIKIASSPKNAEKLTASNFDELIIFVIILTLMISMCIYALFTAHKRALPIKSSYGIYYMYLFPVAIVSFFTFYFVTNTIDSGSISGFRRLWYGVAFLFSLLTSAILSIAIPILDVAIFARKEKYSNSASFNAALIPIIIKGLFSAASIASIIIYIFFGISKMNPIFLVGCIIVLIYCIVTVTFDFDKISEINNNNKDV